jgi:hypothetical protein
VVNTARVYHCNNDLLIDFFSWKVLHRCEQRSYQGWYTFFSRSFFYLNIKGGYFKRITIYIFNWNSY